MILTVRGLPANTTKRDIRSIIEQKCNIGPFLLGEMEADREGALRVTVGCMDQHDGAVVLQMLDGFTMGCCTLSVGRFHGDSYNDRTYYSSNTRRNGDNNNADVNTLQYHTPRDDSRPVSRDDQADYSSYTRKNGDTEQTHTDVNKLEYHMRKNYTETTNSTDLMSSMSPPRRELISTFGNSDHSWPTFDSFNPGPSSGNSSAPLKASGPPPRGIQIRSSKETTYVGKVFGKYSKKDYDYIRRANKLKTWKGQASSHIIKEMSGDETKIKGMDKDQYVEYTYILKAIVIERLQQVLKTKLPSSMLNLVSLYRIKYPPRGDKELVKKALLQAKLPGTSADDMVQADQLTKNVDNTTNIDDIDINMDDLEDY